MLTGSIDLASAGKQVAAVSLCCDFWCLTPTHAILEAVKSHATNFLHLSFSLTCTHGEQAIPWHNCLLVEWCGRLIRLFI